MSRPRYCPNRKFIPLLKGGPIMADQKSADNPEGQQTNSVEQELRQHELVDKLLPDPSQPQPLTVLSGFLGKSTQAGHWRLYLTTALNEYVEVPEENIIHTKSLGPEQSALGRTVIWLRSDTPLQYTRFTSRQIQAEFLEGTIASGFRAQAGVSRATMVPGARFPRPMTNGCSDVWCPTDRCSTDYLPACPTVYCTPKTFEDWCTWQGPTDIG